MRDVMAISQKYQLSEILARVLANRAIGNDQVNDFMLPKLKNLIPDPFHFKDMDKAVRRSIEALHQKQKITVFGDYDVDGATSSSLLKRFFKAIGLDISIYIPDRLLEGYGPSAQAMDFLKEHGTDLVIIVDSGTTAFEAIHHAKTIGLDVIVLDHHIGEPKLPEAYAIVNPNRLDETSPHTYLAAVGMSFLFICGIVKQLKKTDPEIKLPDVRQFLDLVALGTVCDVVPLKPLNRAFIQQGLKIMQYRENIGIAALMDVIDMDSIPTAYHLGFLLGPRINAGSRIDKSSLGATLLSTNNSIEAKEIAQKLNELNRERQLMESQIIEEAIAMVESKNLDKNPIICVAQEGWHVGIIGIVAGRLKEKYNRPTIIIAIDEKGIGKGSGRSISGLDLGSAMHAARQKGLLINGGGHAMAAGLTIEKDNIEAFNQFLQTRLPNGPIETHVTLDTSISLRGITPDLSETLDQLAPFGPENPTPKFLIEQVHPYMAKVVGKDHVSCLLKAEDSATIQAIAFRAANTPLGKFLLESSNKKCSVAGTIKLDTWQGQKRNKLFISDIMVQDDI
jgi:single-stranded-DNA-specific exonuclease